MSNLTLSILWAFLYAACAILGFLPASTNLILGLRVMASLLFFVPPVWMLYRAVKENNRKVIRNIWIVSLIWLITAMILIVCNILSVGASQWAGNVLHVLLVVLASPMVCGRIWVLSLFLMACLMVASLQQLKKMK